MNHIAGVSHRSYRQHSVVLAVVRLLPTLIAVALVVVAGRGLAMLGVPPLPAVVFAVGAGLVAGVFSQHAKLTREVSD